MNQHLEYAKKKELILGFNRSAVAALVTDVNKLSIQDPVQVLAGLTGDVVCKTRLAMEEDLSIVHPILYMLVVDSTGKKFVKYLRGSNGTETRLRDNSCGFGGHVDIIDFVWTPQGVLDPVATVMASGYRELYEELQLTAPVGYDYSDVSAAKLPPPYGIMHDIGVIYEPADDVGSTHLAIVCVFQLADGVAFRSGEDDISAPAWMEFDAPEVKELKFENWSQYLLDQAPAMLAKAGIDGSPMSHEWLMEHYKAYETMQNDIAQAV
jgi:predicted NUDIX family phosphoesterase